MTPEFVVGKVVKVKAFHYDNIHGGTAASDGSYSRSEKILGNIFSIRIEKCWYDYECGERAIGCLTSKRQTDELRPKSQNSLNRVYISEFDVIK